MTLSSVSLYSCIFNLYKCLCYDGTCPHPLVPTSISNNRQESQSAHGGGRQRGSIHRVGESEWSINRITSIDNNLSYLIVMCPSVLLPTCIHFPLIEANQWLTPLIQLWDKKRSFLTSAQIWLNLERTDRHSSFCRWCPSSVNLRITESRYNSINWCRSVDSSPLDKVFLINSIDFYIRNTNRRSR